MDPDHGESLADLKDLIAGNELIVAPGRAQPDHGAAGRGRRLQGGLSQRRLARLAQVRHRGQSHAARDGRRRRRHARRLQAADRPRCRRRLGDPSTCTAPSRYPRPPASPRSRSRTSCCRAVSTTTSARRARSTGLDGEEDGGGGRRAHRSRPGHHRPHQCAAVNGMDEAMRRAEACRRPAPTCCSSTPASPRTCASSASDCPRR